MVPGQKKVRALGLCSGGLDSILSALVLRRQNIEVAWVSFETPFFSSNKAKKAAAHIDVPLTVRNITDRYVRMLRNPRCGYGQNMNPCLDCHALMFRLAGEMMQEKGFDFLFSGEVLGQRPMSQTRNSLRYVEKNSGFEGYIVRPLSIHKLPPTVPEQNGWIDRKSLYGITGRSRKPQLALAEQMGVTDFPNPGGGCLLTERSYATRLKDLFDRLDHDEVDDEVTLSEGAFHLLKYGRHFRISFSTRLIVGRDQRDNDAIMRYCDPKRDTLIITRTIPGPLGLIPGGSSMMDTMTAAAICIGYTKASPHTSVEIKIIRPDRTEIFSHTGLPPREASRFMI